MKPGRYRCGSRAQEDWITFGRFLEEIARKVDEVGSFVHDEVVDGSWTSSCRRRLELFSLVYELLAFVGDRFLRSINDIG